jgi:hypothetical protein
MYAICLNGALILEVQTEKVIITHMNMKDEPDSCFYDSITFVNFIFLIKEKQIKE